MIKPAYLSVLRKICLRLEKCTCVWAVTGSLGMALQGMDLPIHDIDLQTDQPGTYEIEALLHDHIVQPVRYLASERIRSHLGALEIDGVKVEIMGDVQKLLADQTWEAPVRIEPHRQWVRLEDIRVPVLTLEYEYEAYQKLNRPEKAAQIKEWLENHRR